MSSELTLIIERLLFHNDTVVLPGLGAFVTQPAPASVDYAGGTITPPSKILTFSENLTTDDGLITYEIVQQKGINDQDAKAWVEEQINLIITQLNQREIVTLPGIGRLYKNYVQKIQFLPDAANFSRDSFGLPPLQFSPLSRSREVTDTPPTPTPTTTTASGSSTATPATNSPASPPVFTPSTSSPGLNWSRLLAMIGLIALSGGIGYYALQMRQNNLLTKQQQNTSTETTTPETAPVEEQSIVPTPATQPPAKVATPPKAPIAAPAEKTADKSCILVIGLFKDPTNIARLKASLKKNGFEVYSSTGASGAESIGVQFKYSDPSEVQTKLTKLQKLTGEQNIKIKKR